MNAYELADELIAKKNIFDKPRNTDAANMLRQQADRIADLEKEVEEYEELEQNYMKAIQRLQDRLQKEKQSEPVAWMQMHYKDNVPTKFSPVKVWEDDIPLYTTPQTKPLSDEEIDKILESLDVYIDTHAGVKLFARAIEERHGIK